MPAKTPRTKPAKPRTVPQSVALVERNVETLMAEIAGTAVARLEITPQQMDRVVVEAVGAAVRAAVYAVIPGKQSRKVIAGYMETGAVAAARALGRRRAAIRRKGAL